MMIESSNQSLCSERNKIKLHFGNEIKSSKDT